MLLIAFILLSFCQIFAEELTFELPDNEKMCFHEIVEHNSKYGLEYQVITGGNYDVDVMIKGPRDEILYTETKKQYDSFSWNATKSGELVFCFSNEFSTFTHKLIYFDFKSSKEIDAVLQAVPGAEQTHTALTQMETSGLIVHENLRSVEDYQTHHRLREAQGEEFAEQLNQRVQIWSIGQSLVFLLVGVGQVVILRSFFTQKR